MTYSAYCVLNDYGKEAQSILKEAGIVVTIAPSSTRPNEEELMSLVKQYDILIIGAGPGGIFSAFELIHRNPSLRFLRRVRCLKSADVLSMESTSRSVSTVRHVPS